MSDWSLVVEREFAVRCHECKATEHGFMTRAEAQEWATRSGWKIVHDGGVPELLCYRCAQKRMAEE